MTHHSKSNEARRRRGANRRQRTRAKVMSAIDFEVRHPLSLTQLCPDPVVNRVPQSVGEQHQCSVDIKEADLYVGSTTQAEGKMTIINTHEIALIAAGSARQQAIAMLHRSGFNDAEKLQRLVGQRCRKDDRLYEIASVDYKHGGFIVAKGYRVENGVRSKKAWDIGALTVEMFDGL